MRLPDVASSIKIAEQADAHRRPHPAAARGTV
jgi:hypothetical protein